MQYRNIKQYSKKYCSYTQQQQQKKKEIILIHHFTLRKIRNQRPTLQHSKYKNFNFNVCFWCVSVWQIDKWNKTKCVACTCICWCKTYINTTKTSFARKQIFAMLWWNWSSGLLEKWRMNEFINSVFMCVIVKTIRKFKDKRRKINLFKKRKIVFDNAPPPGWSVIANTQPYRQMHGVWGWVCLESTQPFYYRNDRKCARSRVTVSNWRHELSISSPCTIKRDHSFIELEGRKMRERIGGIQVFSFPSPRPVYPCYAEVP